MRFLSAVFSRAVLVVGKTLSHFEIQQKIGQGGMGVVYRALDTRLNRTVAIKVLSPELLRDPSRQQHFVRESRAASALNHPNIITIYEIDHQQEADFIAMEFVAGETLDAVIRRGPMRLSEALRYGMQVADALAAAHTAGIVHRDLKPANIMVTGAGLVKILDFGVAKLIAPTEAEGHDAGETATTLTAGLEPGKVMGTAPYMSPEHLVGHRVDVRSDIFSFGTVLYEMATGRRAFQGENKVAMAAAVLATEPVSPSEIVPSLPPEFGHLIKRCLEKDANRRYQNAGELRVALETLLEAIDSGRVTTATTRRPRSRLGLGSAILAGIAAVIGIAWLAARRGNPAPPSTMIRLTSDAGLNSYPALSPDGKFVVYASDRAGNGNLDLWLQQIGGGTPIRLTQGADDSYDPDFSPDGTRIVYRSERDAGGVYMISTLGGEPRRLAAEGRHPRFSPDGTRIAWWTGAVGGDLEGAGASKIFVASLTGAAPLQIRPEFAAARAPAWLPDGKHLLFAGGPGKKYGWYVTPLDGGPAVDTGAYELCLQQKLNPKEGSWAVDGNRVIFAATSGDTKNLWQIELSHDWKVASIPKRLTFGSGHEVQPSLARGQVAFASLIDAVQVWTLPIDAQGAAAGEPVQLTRGAADNVQATLSADGRTLGFISFRAGNYDIWLRDMTSGREKRLLETRDSEYYPTLSPDASKIAWYNERDRQRQTFVMNTSGGTPQQVCDGCGTISSWSADNRRLLFITLDQPRRGVGVLEVPDGKQTVLLEDAEHSLYQPVFSPDDRWIVFYARLSPSRTQLFITRYDEEADHGRQNWIAVTDGSSYDAKPRWAVNGNAIYFFSERDRFRCIWMQRLDPKTKRPQGPARAVWHFHNDKRPLMNVGVNALGLAVGPDKIAFNLIEATGNIWLSGP